MDGLYIIGTRRTIRELADGSLRVQIEVDPQHKEDFFRFLPETDMPVALVPLSPGRVTPAGGRPGEEREFSLIGELHRCGIFNARSFLEALGPDDAYLRFVQSQPCKACGCDAPSQAAHVRRINQGAGVGIKPEYSAIPLCPPCHAAQHQQGESAIGGKEKVDRWAADMRSNWGHDALRELFDVESAKDIDPAEFLEWANENGVSEKLPVKIRNYLYNQV